MPRAGRVGLAAKRGGLKKDAAARRWWKAALQLARWRRRTTHGTSPLRHPDSLRPPQETAAPHSSILNYVCSVRAILKPKLTDLANSGTFTEMLLFMCTVPYKPSKKKNKKINDVYMLFLSI